MGDNKMAQAAVVKIKEEFLVPRPAAQAQPPATEAQPATATVTAAPAPEPAQPPPAASEGTEQPELTEERKRPREETEGEKKTEEEATGAGAGADAAEDADGEKGKKRQRGMNRKREVNVKLPRTERPSFEGEQNFLEFGLCKLLKEQTKALRASRRSNEKKPQTGQKGTGQKPATEKEEATANPAAAGAVERTEGGAAPACGNQPTEAAKAEPAAPAANTEPADACLVKPEPTATDSAAKPEPAAAGALTNPEAAATDALRKEDERQLMAVDDASTAQRGAALFVETPLRPLEKRRVDFAGKLYLGPLTTLGNLPYRRICKRFGADITVSEMAMTYNLLNGQSSEWSLLRKHECEDVFGIQVAAAHQDQAALLGKVLEESGFHFDFIDLNCGCPVDSICHYGVGSSLLDNPRKLGAVCRGLNQHTSRPITIKVRTGRDLKTPTIHKWMHQLPEWGVSAWTIHGRSRQQRYTKLANWDYISECAKASPIPTIGNGDVYQFEEYYERLETSGVQGVMLARGALVKPWLFTEIKERRVWDISANERLDILRDFCNYGLSHWGADEKGRLTTRRFLCEWLSFLCRYVPAGIVEGLQRINERPPDFRGRNDLETLMASPYASDWVKISSLLLGPAPPEFKFTPKHKSASYDGGDAGMNG